ncbi:tol-pal system YbgF family protein [Acidisphaera rubrifaciens]|uniref:TolA-binding protein n=1 Tax=Acidisphaera rubrifaciens HS-AP3 TaxID=1231350 RepID=A0A0D6P914_9PROT|nr:hypothetical protein [Acidisphaera rubrifaciens]GAN77683.1 hypothetical protein Asru_0418_04 [Acidisphaera rubrifaciens HS-AP3]
MSPLRWRPVAAVCLAVALAPFGARAQIAIDSREGIALQNQIAELRHEVESLQGQISSGGGGGGGGVLAGSPPPAVPSGASGDLIAALVSRVQALEDETRRLRGRVDELQNTQQHQYDDLNKQIGDLNFKLGGGAGGGAPAAAPPPASYGSPPPYTPPTYSPPASPPGRGAAAAPTGPRTPERAIAEGYADLGRRDYAGATAAAREVLDNNRTSPRAYDAQYLLAQALAGKRDYAQAAIAYDDTYNRARTGTHAPEALVGLASSLNAIGERKAACETLAKLAREFPKVRPDVHNAAGAVRVRAGCS